MSLRDDANDLAEVLNQVLDSLRAYQADDRADYAASLARRLAPPVEAYAHAVKVERSRETAADVLATLKPLMEEINGACTKGDMTLIDSDVLNRFWDLQTIFQEARYRDETL